MNLAPGTRVRLTKVPHAKHDKACTIINALPNPSQRSEHQWYDVRFDDGTIGRFIEKHLMPIAPLTTAGTTSTTDGMKQAS